jgi:beta-N-acetylhexosaminidase
MIMGGMTGRAPSAALLARVRAGQVGGIILFGANIATSAQVQAATASLQQAASAGGNPPLLIATDQEGGTVRRFQSVAPTMSAAQMGASGPRTAANQGAATASGLRALGVNADLAPVADVPTSSTNFLGTRAFSHTPGVVGATACAFADALASGRVTPTLKHFPGLGAAGANTDSQAVTISLPLAALRHAWTAYARCAPGSDRMVMVSNAAYSSMTGRTPAVFSPATYAALAGLGFHGVTISDSLEAGAVKAWASKASTAAKAGLDIQLYTTETDAATAYQQLLAAANSNASLRSQVARSASKIRQLKQQVS